MLFSGGLDSTYMVAEYLCNHGPVDVLYVNGSQHPVKMELELEARKALIAKMNEYYPNKVQKQYVIEEHVYRHDGKNKKWIQPNAWLQGAFAVLDPERHSCLQVAYVNDDGAYFGQQLKTIQDLWDSLIKVSYTGDHVPLEFPYISTNKLAILTHFDKRLLPHVWVCENPTSSKKACQRCSPCKLINRVLWEYKQQYGETVWRAVKKAERAQATRGDGWVHGSCYSTHTPDIFDDWRFIPESKLETKLIEEIDS